MPRDTVTHSAELHRTLRKGAREKETAIVMVMCDGKDQLTWPQAKAILDRMRGNRSKRLTAYHCPVCHGWHIGNPIKKKKPWRWM